MNYSDLVTDPYAWSNSFDLKPPLLTSEVCAESLTAFFGDPAALAVATESSSHATGLTSLYAQPYIYAGGGLGNIDECPLQTCLAGAGMRRDSITFAAICVVPECSAFDLASKDFPSVVERVSARAQDQAIAQDYTLLIQRIEQVNEFLGTGWICGDFVVPWQFVPFGIPYMLASISFVCLSSIGMWKRRKHNLKRRARTIRPSQSDSFAHEMTRLVHSGSDEEKKQENLSPREQMGVDNGVANGDFVLKDLTYSSKFWSAFDVSSHLKLLTTQPSEETSCLDGLRVGSLFWIMLGHVMAIVSSSGGGYSNPANFLPPSGLTTTFLGQLLFSARQAVDSFLSISGFLVVHVLIDKVPLGNNHNFIYRYLTFIPSLLLARVARILPLYAMCIGFYTQIAPHMGSGPFWYQWIELLRPCHDYGWTNFLFINNFYPFDTPVTDSCFYHSWYLAVDMQLFLFAPLLVFLYQANPYLGKLVTGGIWLLFGLITVYLSYVRRWSINTFDGAAVARYDVEAYAMPHTRAQSYLGGMLVAMLLPKAALTHRSPYTRKHRIIMSFAIVSMIFVTFFTATGAYARRPCQYHEWPEVDHCGSEWPFWLNFLYTAFSRMIWTVAVCTLMHLCLGRSRDGNIISGILSWKCWTPLSHLSFGAYLIHPIVIFVWQLGDREKEVFRLDTFGMNCLSVFVVSYVAALLAALVVELPCSCLWKTFCTTGVGGKRTHRISSQRTRSGVSYGSQSSLNEFSGWKPTFTD